MKAFYYELPNYDSVVHSVKGVTRAKSETEAIEHIASKYQTRNFLIVDIPKDSIVKHSIVKNAIYKSYNRTKNTILKVQVTDISETRVSAKVIKNNTCIDTDMIVLPIVYFKHFFELSNVYV